MLAALASTACFGAPLYRATDVGLAEGAHETVLTDLNDRSEGVGYSGSSAVSWTPSGGLAVHPQPRDGRDLSVRRLNDRREGAGSMFTGDVGEAVLVHPDRTLDFFLRGTWAEPGFGYGVQFPPIRDISDAGEVLGVSDRPWLWSPSAGLRPIGGDDGVYLVARVNNHGQVAGARDFAHANVDCYGSRAFVWDDPAQRFVAVDGGPPDIHEDVCARFSDATALNDAGQVVGYANEVDLDDPSAYVPFIWTKESGTRRLRNTDPTRRDFVPADINRHGQVVGTFEYRQGGPLLEARRFFYWDARTGLVDIQDLLDPDDPATALVHLRTGGYDVQINDRGVVSLPGRRTGDPGKHWFLLFPQ